MKIKIHFRKNLKISKQKLAATCAHIGNHLGQHCCSIGYTSDPIDDIVIVLSTSDKKFKDIKESVLSQEDLIYHLHTDNGFTEVEPDTEIALGWVVEE